MVTKQGYIRIGQGVSVAGGILFVIGGIILVLSIFMENFVLNSVVTGLIIGTPFYIIELDVLILTLISMIIGAITIIAVTREKHILAGGIIVIVLGILGLGIPGGIIIVGGSIYIVASTRNR